MVFIQKVSPDFSITIIGTLSQTITYGTILPLYLFLHVLTSPTNLGPLQPSSSSEDPANAFLIDPAELAAWPIAFTLSYLLPTLLVALPSPTYTSFATHQNIMAVWELYPIPFKIFQVLLARYFASLLARDPAPQSASQRKASVLKGLRYTYAFSAAVGAVSHIITLTLSYSSVFFPTLYNAASRSGLGPSSVFLGVSPFYSTPVKNLGEGLWHFLIWNMNVSNVAPLLWALLQCRNAHEGRKEWEGWISVLMKIGAVSMVAGPAAGTAALMWVRDELVLNPEVAEKAKKNR